MKAAIMALLICCTCAAFAADLTGTARVIDVDTIEIGTSHVRLYGIDAPELHQRCQRCGRRSAFVAVDDAGRA